MAITWNPLDKGANVTLSNENLTATLGDLHAVRATEGKSTGKWYWEILVEPNNTSHVALGVDDGSEVVNHHGSASGNNAIRMYGSTGEKAGTTRTAYGQTYGANDVIGVALNIDDGIIGFYKNGVYQGDAFNDLAGMSKPIFPRVSSWSSNGVKIVSTNFGHKPFKYSIPKGYYSYDGNQYGSNDKILILSNDNKVKSLEYVNNNTPIMTSNTSPYGEAKASNVYSSFYPYRAFDGQIGGWNSGWVSNGNKNQWISYSYPYLVDISKYAIWSVRNGSMPKEFRFEVSNDGVNWTVIDQRIMTLNDWQDNDWNYFNLDKPVKAKSFRLYCVDNNGHSSYIAIPEMKLIGEYNHLIELPSISEQNFINYGMYSPIENLNSIFSNKNYILTKEDSQNEQGLWTTQINRKPLSIVFK